MRPTKPGGPATIKKTRQSMKPVRKQKRTPEKRYNGEAFGSFLGAAP